MILSSDLCNFPQIAPIHTSVDSYLIFLSFLFSSSTLPHGSRNLSSPTRDRTPAPSNIEVWILNQLTAREIPNFFFFQLLCCLVTKLYPTLCDPMECSTPGSSVLCYLLSLAQFLSHVQLFTTPWTATHQASLSITNSQSLLKLMSIALVMPFNHLLLCHPLLLLPSIFPSITVFSNESVLHIRCPKYWSLSFNISPSNWISRTDFL